MHESQEFLEEPTRALAVERKNQPREAKGLSQLTGHSSTRVNLCRISPSEEKEVFDGDPI